MKLAAVERVQGWIEFSPTGHVLDVSETFLSVIGYTRREVLGQHHRLFCEPTYAASADYVDFWQRLARGEADAGVYPRRAKSGAEVWLQASYTPVRNWRGRVTRIVKFATDITEQQQLRAADLSRLQAIDRTSAVIEFALDGTVRTANANFLQAMGYRLEEIVGKHHRLFVDPAMARSTEYAQFWRRLGAGEAFVGTYPRRAKGGREIWIQGSYNPLLNASGRPYGVIKVCSDVTTQVHGRQQLEALVHEANVVLRAVSTGNLTPRLRETFPGTLGELARDINGTIATLGETLTEVEATSRSTAHSVAHLRAGSDELAQRTHAQVSALEETAAAMEELTASVSRNAEHAQQADIMGRSTREVAQRATLVTADATEAMTRISESGRRIGEITSVIDGIAFQTNLLALNAAVEAARAGDHGRGFAVVADEVRTLAQRSAAAAREIGGLIDETLQRVAHGNRLVTETADTLGQITQSVGVVTGLVEDIAAASREQAAGIAQVNHAISAMDNANQANASLVEKLSVSSKSLQDDVDHLQHTVSQFVVEERPALAMAG